MLLTVVKTKLRPQCVASLLNMWQMHPVHTHLEKLPCCITGAQVMQWRVQPLYAGNVLEVGNGRPISIVVMTNALGHDAHAA